MHEAPAASDDHSQVQLSLNYNCHSQGQLLSRSPPGHREYERNYLGWVSQGVRLRTFPNQVQAHTRVRIMKIFHQVTFVEGIINDFSFYKQIFRRRSISKGP